MQIPGDVELHAFASVVSLSDEKLGKCVFILLLLLLLKVQIIWYVKIESQKSSDG